MNKCILLFSFVIALLGCENYKSVDPEMQRLHDEIVATGRTIRLESDHKMTILLRKIDAMRAEGDSLVVGQLLFLKAELDNIVTDVTTLEGQAEQIPGPVHQHDHDDPHHHHHGPSPLIDMPAEELKELQKELHIRMAALKHKHDNIHVD